METCHTVYSLYLVEDKEWNGSSNKKHPWKTYCVPGTQPLTPVQYTTTDEVDTMTVLILEKT